MIEHARKWQTRSMRSVKLPGRPAQEVDTDPVRIARELRAKSQLGEREKQLAAAEAKIRG